jgi:hypothetical protein
MSEFGGEPENIHPHGVFRILTQSRPFALSGPEWIRFDGRQKTPIRERVAGQLKLGGVPMAISTGTIEANGLSQRIA